MATVLKGVVDDSDILADELVVQMTDAAHVLDTDTSQFTTILDKLPQGTIQGTKKEWREDEFLPAYTTLGANALNTDTTITVAAGTGAYFKAGSIFKIMSTGERVKVVSSSGDVLTVTRGLGNVAAAGATSGDKVLILGSAYAQGADTPDSRVVKRVLGYNYTQIQRDSLKFTRSLIQSQTYGGNERDVERRKKLVEHKRSLESMFVAGPRSLDTSGSEPEGHCGGYLEFISTNSFNVAGALSQSYFETKMQSVLEHGDAGSKVAFVGPTAAAALSAMLLNKWAIADPGTSVYGAKVDAWVSGAFGWNIPIMVKRNWTSNGMNGEIHVIDLSLVKRHTLQDTVLLTNRQGNGVDGTTEEYLTEATLEFAQEKAHGRFYGITG